MRYRSIVVLTLFFCAVGVAALFPVESYAQSSDSINERVSGHIVLNVEGAGEAWYVSPVDGLRYELGRPEQAFEVMRTFALGISNRHLAGIPRHEELLSGDTGLRQTLAGRLLLQVENHGEVWYVHPESLKRHYLGRPLDAFNVMRELGLGITRVDLAQIQQGVLGANTIDDVPFYAQAPRGNWSDLRQQEGCEEASVLMAQAWVSGQTLTVEEAEQEIIRVSEYERERWGYFVDTSAQDTHDRLVQGYYGLDQAEVYTGIDEIDVLNALASGSIVLITVNGQDLQNPYFQGNGPLRHMLIVHGYDYITGEFITHEPGTTRGQDYRYSFDLFRLAINDYNSGVYAPLPAPARTAMITVSRP